jgi:hypothetical protein
MLVLIDDGCSGNDESEQMEEVDNFLHLQTITHRISWIPVR